MGKLFCVMGKSASGKDTIYKELIKDKELALKNVVPYTTRPKRNGEAEGETYWFVDEERFNLLKTQGKIVEDRAYHTAHGLWRYFTVDDGQIDFSRGDYMIIGTLEAYTKMCQYFGDEKVVPIYINVEDGLRLLRALERERKQEQPKYVELCRRFIADSEDFSKENIEKCNIDIVFENEDLNTCIEKVKHFIIKKCN